jgi:hypothetical protein
MSLSIVAPIHVDEEGRRGGRFHTTGTGLGGRYGCARTRCLALDVLADDHARLPTKKRGVTTETAFHFSCG